MFACVRYKDDLNKKHIVATSFIKGFDPENVCTDLMYDIWWNPPTTSKNTVDAADYYPGQILLVKSTKEEVEKAMEVKRLPHPKLPFASETINPSQPRGRKDQPCGKETKSKIYATTQKALSAIMKKSSSKKKKRIMDETSESSAEEEIMTTNLEIEKRQDEYNSLLQRCQRLHKDNDRLRMLNEDLQKALLTKVFDIERHIEMNTVEKLNRVIEEHSLVAKQAPMAAFQLVDEKETTMPKRMQNSEIQEPMGSSKSNIVQNEESMILDRSIQDMLQNVTSDVINVPFSPTIREETMDVDLGGVYITVTQWNTINHTSKTPSIFCKELAAAIWSPEVLLERSVTGKVSNANGTKQQKPALTPHKRTAIVNAVGFHMKRKGMTQKEIEQNQSKVNLFIKQKIQDLRKAKMKFPATTL